MPLHSVRRIASVAIVSALLVPSAVRADETLGDVAGSIASIDGRAVAGAFVAFDGPAHYAVVSDRFGRFVIRGMQPGTYAAHVGATQFTSPAVATVDVRANLTATVAIALARSGSSLTTIGRVVVGGRDAASTSATPVTKIDPQTYADEGYTRVSDMLQNDATTTLFHTAGGGSTVLPTSIALRGPDPTETLVDIDGHQINNGNTGDFDLSLLDPADYASIELVRGISPSSLVGPDTIDGAINLRTLEPTVDPHGLLRLTGGSFGAFGSTLQTTGTFDGRLGYAVSLHRQGTNGEVHEDVFDEPSGSVQHVGSEMLGSSAVGKLRFAFGASGAGYAELSFHDQSAFRDLSAGLTTYAAPGAGLGSPANLPIVDSDAGTALQSHNAGYGLDALVPLGSPGASGVAATNLTVRHYTSLVDESVYGPGAETSPYLFNSRDRLDDETLQLDHRIGNGMLTLQYEIRNESLSTDFLSGVVNEESSARRSAQDADSANAATTLPLGQTQRSLALRYTYDPAAALHFVLGAYYSRLSLFGNFLDPRFGFVFTPDSRTSVRVSAGTTFQSPQLPELVVPNALPVVVGNYISIGNPHLRPDRATEYGLGIDRVIGGGANPSTVSADVYRVNVRQPASTLNLPLDPNCGPASAGGDGTACPLSYPVNAGDAVYAGLELSARHSFGPFTTLRAGWAVRSAYLTAVPPDIQDGTLVVGEQSAGLPLHKATLAFTVAPPRGFIFGVDGVYESLYNELNEPAFATVGAHLGYRFRTFEVQLSGTNLTNVYDRRFTTPNGGVVYGGLGQNIAQDAYALTGTALSVSIVRRF